MLGHERYMALNDTDGRSSEDLNQVPEMKTGRFGERPVLGWLDLLAAGVSRMARVWSIKPWRTCRRARPGNQTENRLLGLMTRKALTGMGEPCFPSGRMSRTGVLRLGFPYQTSVSPGFRRIGGRQRRHASRRLTFVFGTISARHL